MLLFTIWLKAFRQPRRFTFGWLVALKTGHAGTAAGTGVRTFPRLIGMCFAKLAAIVATQASHGHSPKDIGLAPKNANPCHEKPHYWHLGGLPVMSTLLWQQPDPRHAPSLAGRAFASLTYVKRRSTPSARFMLEAGCTDPIG
jgi:hypothetical protein